MNSAYLWKQAEEAYKSLKIEGGGPGAFAGIEKKTVLSREGLKQADPAIRHRVMLMAFSEIGLYEDIASAHLEAADSVIFSGSASAEAHFPGNYILAVSYGSAAAYLSNEERVCAPAPDLSLKSKVLPIDEYRAALPVKGCRAAAFDCGRIKSAAENALDVLAVRGREEGDFFTPAGMKSGRKKVQDYFVDRKIPKEERARFRLVALGSEALWIFDPLSCGNGEINERYKINENTKDVLLLEIDSEL